MISIMFDGGILDGKPLTHQSKRSWIVPNGIFIFVQQQGTHLYEYKQNSSYVSLQSGDDQCVVFCIEI